MYACWLKAKRNKSQSLRVQRFDADPLHYLVTVQRRLREREFTFGPYKAFIVREKKFRHVIDAPMKDRVVHWMLYQYLLPIWQPRFIHDTYGNLPGRGTHAAVERLAKFCRSASAKWVLQLDISKYFYSVSHELLKARALRYIGDHRLRKLVTSLIDSFRTDATYDHLFPEDSAYRRTVAKGMPIGNLSSQLFANIFLADFDAWVKGELRVRRYIRYVDDLVVVCETPDELRAVKDAIVAKLAADGLTVHPRKVRIAPVRAGVPFLGYVVWPNHVSAGAYVRSRYIRRLREHESGGYDRTETLQAYRAMLAHTGPFNTRRGGARPNNHDQGRLCMKQTTMPAPGHQQSDHYVTPSYDRYGRMNFHPDFHGKQGTPWTTADEKYLIDNYYADGPEQVSLSLERTIHTVMTRAYELRKAGRLSTPAKRLYTKRSRAGACDVNAAGQGAAA